MKPIHFDEVNHTYAKDQSQYIPLPTYKKDDVFGEVISCWGLSFTERIRLLFTGKIWMSVLSFNEPLTPSKLTTIKTEVIIG